MSRNVMRTNQAGINLIMEFEGLHLTPYRDPIGLWTIGYGHLITRSSELPEIWNRTITKEEARQLLKADLGRFERGVESLTAVPLNENQFSALVSFCFNLGTGAYQRSTLRRKINRGEYDEAAREFRKWVYAGGIKFRGLVRRRQAEEWLFTTTTS